MIILLVSCLNEIKDCIYYIHGYHEYKKFKNYYCKKIYINNKLYMIRCFNYSAELHNDDGPAFITYNKNGEISTKSYYVNGTRY